MGDFDVCSTGCTLTGCAHPIRLPTNPEGVPTYFMMPDANVSGPIKKDKTFFFFGYQRLHEKKIAQARGAVPTPAMLGGDFYAGWRSAIPSTIQQPHASLPMAPGCVIPFPGNIIPLSRFDPVARKLLS